MNIIILDFDGVINSDHYHRHEVFGGADFTLPDQLRALSRDPKQMLDPKAISCLKEICDTSKASLVISSSWRLIYSLPDIIQMFEDNGWANPPIIGTLPDLRADKKNRGDELNSWLQANNKEQANYLILDDVDDFHANQADKLFQTTIETGLTNDHVHDVLKMLLGTEYEDDCAYSMG